MSDWWKNPVLQGEDNEYGEYDYMVSYDYTHLPESCAKWQWDKTRWNCDSCRKPRHLLLRSTQWFYTMDGGDSLSYNECWICMLKSKISSTKLRVQRNFKKTIASYKLAIKWCIKEKSFKHWKVYLKLAKS